MAMENMTTLKLSNIRFILVTAVAMCVAVTLVVLSMPNTERPPVSYNIGEPWLNAQLISPSDILILKDAKLVEKERQEALRDEYIPYYTLNPETGKKQINAFLEKYGEGIGGVSAYSMQVVANIMENLYEKGIMPQADHSNLLSEDSLATIMQVYNKEATRINVADVYSTKQAYETILADSRLNGVREQLRKCNINEFLRPNITLDENLCEQTKRNIISTISDNTGQIKAGQEIIDRGEIVTEEKARMLDSYNQYLLNDKENSKGEILLTNIIQWLYVMMLAILFLFYMYFFRRDYLNKLQSLAMIYFLLTIFPIINSLMMRFLPEYAYVVPLCLVPMFTRVFLDSRTAFMTHTTMVLICAANASNKFEFIIVQMAAGVVAICALRELYKRSQLFNTALFCTITGIIAFTMLKFLDARELSFDILRRPYITLVINGVLLLLAYPLMYLVEKPFGFISPITLFEFSDTNSPLLRKLSEVAPGTFQHSIMVSNIAAAIASEVGAKSLLVRTGALYHDIGKMKNPAFFTENQSGVNPHDRMTPQESAQIITGHVMEGVKLADKYGVPDVIKNLILTHHGKGTAKFFYTTYKNAHPDEEIDDTPFRYPGPNPFSKEQAILMMADAVEAASRSLNEYTEDTISALVNRIVDGQVAEGYFAECPVTFKDIAIAKHIMIERLTTMYHTRIQYPELKSGQSNISK